MTDTYNRHWIIKNAVEVSSLYAEGDLTVRAMHYKLVGRGMPNTDQHYKRVVKAMEVARWDGLLSFETFSDLDRAVIGETMADDVLLNDEIRHAKEQVKAWMNAYNRNRWESQEYYPEVWIEKKTLQNVFAPVCREFDIALAPCKGYPSLTFLNEAAQRFKQRWDKKCVILYFGDYDPSGEDIPRSLEINLGRMGVNIEVKRFALFEEQVRKWNLPPAPVKEFKRGVRKNGTIGFIGDSREKEWSGIGQVELDAVDVHDLRQVAREAILSVYDHVTGSRITELEKEERKIYQASLKEFVKTL